MDSADLGRASFYQEEFRRIMLPDTVVEQLCARHCDSFLPHQSEAAPVIAKQLAESVRRRLPASLVRVGNGEGNVLALTNGGPNHAAKLEDFNGAFKRQNGIALPEPEAYEFSVALRDSLLSADFVGFRYCDRLAPSEWCFIQDRIANGALWAASGALYAREFLQDGLTQNLFRRATITSAWIHLGLIRFLDYLMTASHDVIVICGRPELERKFDARLGGRLRSFLSIPVEKFNPGRDSESHYRGHFPRVLEALKQDLRGTLVLVGAGLFGKIYCNVAKHGGAVAVDLGSGLDILAGLSTRPIHAKFDVNASRWI